MEDIAATQALTFTVAGERLALPAADIAEVIRAPAVSRVPLAPQSLAGVANLRGAVIPIVSLSVLLGRDAAAEGEKVIILGGSAPVGLFVDQVSALVPLAGIRAGEEGARLLDLQPLLDPIFGGVRESRSATAGAGAPARSQSTEQALEHAYASFEIAGQEFALPLDDVHEVMRLPDDIAAIPRTDAAMVGVIPLRNRLLPLLSLPVLLGLAGEGASRERRIVVTRLGGTRAGLIVDRLRAIARLPEADIDPVPPVLTRGRHEAQVQAIGRLDQGARLISILSTDHLLQEGLAAQLHATEVEEERSVDLEESGGIEQFVVFTLADEAYGLPIESVVEVVRVPERLTKLPKAPAFVEGIMNLRGKVIPIIDQRRRFETARAAASRGRIVIVRIGEAEAGFIVDAVSEVLRVPAERLRMAPEIGAAQGRVIDRIANLDAEGRMVLLVDPQELLDRAERDLLAEMRKADLAPS
ncbi:chemotaxis protein CheW [Allosphingosinicella deserti]|uniref:chemotaxis protein CheW n=1 Tax=Allosphingosinicella deserti TaxID=2116704 RepID=UPI001304910D|nr:chemotaxis protein CheW [Sphingomonas deserti]